MGRYRQLTPDGSECGCLRAIAVFKPGTLFFQLQVFIHWSILERYRNIRFIRLETRGTATRSGSVHFGRLRATALPATVDALRPIVTTSPLLATGAFVNRRIAILQGNTRRCGHRTRLGRHLHYGQTEPHVKDHQCHLVAERQTTSHNNSLHVNWMSMGCQMSTRWSVLNVSPLTAGVSQPSSR